MENKSISKTGKTEIAKIEDYKINGTAFSETVRRTDVTKKTLVTILQNRNRRIYLLPESKGTNVYLLGEILKIAQAYGATKQISAQVQAECVRILKGQFSKYSMPEVWLAYRMHSAGKLPNDKGKGEMYGGNFTAKSFAAVMAAWNKYKAASVAEYFKQKEKIEDEKAQKLKDERLKESFWPNFVKGIEYLKTKKDVDWRDCLAYQYEVLRDRGYLVLKKDEWKEIWKDANELAKSEVVAERINLKRGKVRLVGAVAEKVATEKTESRAKIIARKLSVFRKVILNPNFSFDSITE